MATYNSFIFEGHGHSEKNGNFDPGATHNGVTEHSLVEAIVNEAKRYLDKTKLNIHYDENNFIDVDVAGNTYTSKCGISVHINSTHGASGVECYVPMGEKYIKFDEDICSAIASKLNIPNRGVRSRDYDSGTYHKRINGKPLNGKDYYGEIREAWNRGISLCILEVGFIQNDLSKIQSNIKYLGYLVAKYIANANDVSITEDKPTAPTPTQPSSGTKYRVVCGTYVDKTNALAQQERLKKAGFDSFLLAYKE